MEEMTTGLCPKCGHTLQIPAELERFSCMYCGERLTKRQLLTQPEEASCSEEDCAVSFDHAVARLGWCVQNFRGYQKKILRDAFFEAFETYETGCAPGIQELNSGVRPERQTELLDRAAEAMLDRAYIPYSHFPVGAALECADGTVFTGCNIENAAYGCTICAERTAIFKAVSEGHRDFVRIVIAGKSEDYCVPCGSCRQVMMEFAPEMEVICLNGQGQARSFRLRELLPYGFDQSWL